VGERLDLGLRVHELRVHHLVAGGLPALRRGSRRGNRRAPRAHRRCYTSAVSEDRPSKPPPPSLKDMTPEQRARLVRIGGAVRDSAVALRLFGDELDPGEVTRLLGCAPTKCARKGDVIPDPKYHRVERRGRWLLDSACPRTVPLDEQVEALLARVTGDLEVWKDLGRRFKMDLFCGVFMDEENRGFLLEAGLVRKLSDRGLAIGFDIYAHMGDGEE